MALTKAQLVDMNANELILDLDADTSITSDTDDQIDIKIGGADDFRFTANTFTGLAGSTITSPTIVGSTSVQTPLIEFTDGDDAMTIADGGVVTFAQAPVFPDGSLAVIDLDIDGATDIGAAIVDADLFIVDDGAGGANRKTAASRLKTYIGGDAGGFPITALDIDGGTDIGAAIVDADLFIVDDGAGGANRKTAASRLLTYAMTGTLTTAAQANVTSLGTLTTLTVDNVITNGATIGHTSDTDLITLADGIVTVAGEVQMTTLDIGGTNVTSTAAEINLLDGKDATHLEIFGKQEGTNFTSSLLVGSVPDGTLNGSERNVGVGVFSMQKITQADDCTAVGFNALRYNRTGVTNTAIGNNSMGNTGNAPTNNTGTGYQALKDVQASYNIGLGAKAGRNITTGSGSLILGNVEADSATADRQLKISGYDGTNTTNWISGDSSGNLTFGGTITVGSATVTEAQLEILDGATVTTTELNTLDGVTLGTAIASKVVTTDSNIDTTGQRNLTISGELDAATLDISGAIDVAGNSVLASVDVTAVATAATFEPDGDTAAGDNAAIGFTAAEGLILTGQGTTNDVTIKNDADADVIEIPTGSVNVTMAGTLAVTGVVSGAGFTAGSATLAESELELLDGLTAGTAIASKVVTTDANIDSTGMRNLTISGELDAATLDISGAIDVAGTSNLDVVDIDGAVDMASTLQVDGVATFTAVPVFPNNTIETADIQADAITAAKIADDAISEEHLDVTAVTGHTAETSVADGDLVVIHDASASALRKMTVANLVANAGGGKVLQVVSVMNNPSSNVNSNSSDYTATGLEAAITPSASNSKVLIFAHGTFQVSGGTGTQTIFRGSTQLASGGGSGTNSFAGMELAGKHYPIMINFLDSPNTTSATTYKLMQLGSGGETIYYNPSTVNSAVMTLMEIGA